MLKKLLPHGLAVLLILTVTLAGCGGGRGENNSPGGDGTGTPPSPTSPPNTSSWKVVGSAGFSDPAENPSIAIAGNGVPYVVYRESNSGKVTVMKFDGTNWITVGSPGFSGNLMGHISIAIAGNGVPYVVYPDSDNHSEATVKKLVDTNWTTVGNPGFSGWSADYPSIAIAGNGVPYVVYCEMNPNADENKITLMKFDDNDGNWKAVDNEGYSWNYHAYPSIAITGNGVPYVAYQDGFNSYGVTVKKFENNVWQVVGSGGFSAGKAYDISIAIDGNNVPYVVYRDGDQVSGKITVKRFGNGQWKEVSNSGFAEGARPAIAIDGNNVPYVVYPDKNNGWRPTVMKFDGTNWIPVGGDGDGVLAPERSEHPSIAIDKYGVPYVVYSNMDNSNKATVMKYAQ